MARIRAIKIGFFKNEDLGALTPWHRLLYEGLWLIADREGRLEDRPQRIKAEVFPYDAAFPVVTDQGTITVLTIDEMLTALSECGQPHFIARYEVEGRRYIQIDPVAWRKHQRPKSDEADSLIPPPHGISADPPLSREEPRGLSRDREDPREEREREGERELINPAPSGAAPADPIRETLTLYDTLYRGKFHSPAPIVRGKDAKLVRGLIARYGAPDVASYLRGFFESPDGFIQHSGYSLGVFASCIGKLIVEARAPAARASPESGRTGPPAKGKYDHVTIRGATA